MNGLFAAMAVANPVITALLTIVVFLEKDKLRKRSEDIEAALKSGNASVVQTIAAQKQDFKNIADRLEALSKDSEKSAATFIGLSTALTESSAVSAKALGGVTEGLQSHATTVSALITDLSKYVSETNANAISELGVKSSDAIKSVAQQVGKVEAAQIASKEASTLAIADLSDKHSQILKLIGEEIKKVEAAQIASKQASSQAVAELSAKTQNSLKIISEEIKRIEVAQAEAAKAATESVAKLSQEVALTNKSIKELQETLKSTVSL